MYCNIRYNELALLPVTPPKSGVIYTNLSLKSKISFDLNYHSSKLDAREAS